jgi:adenine-specific DNA-methyltransferase
MPAEISSDHKAFKAGYKSISDVSKLRIKNVIKEEAPITGFKSLKLVRSNYKPWKNYQGKSVSQLEMELEQFNNSPLRDNFTKDGLLSEIMLLEGFTLCSSVSILDNLKTNQIKKVSSEYCQHHLLVCLDETIAKETISNLTLGDEDIFICLDSAISTEDKLRLSDKGLIKTI